MKLPIIFTDPERGFLPPQHDAHILELVYVGHTWGHTDPNLQKVYKTMLARAIFDQIKIRQKLKADQLLDK